MSHSRGLCMFGHRQKYGVVLQCIGIGLFLLGSRSSIPSLHHLTVNAAPSGYAEVTYPEA